MNIKYNISIIKFFLLNCKLYIIVLIFITQISKTQDIHNSDYSYGQLMLNPALTGNFYGNLRLSSTYRNQGQYFMSDGYKTSQISVDVPFTFSIFTGKKNWMGFGLMVFHDNSGSVSQVTNGINFGLSYHFAFSKKQNNIISAGFQFGRQQRKIDDSKIILESDFNSQSSGLTDRLNLASYGVIVNDIHAGISFKRKFKTEYYFLTGFSVYHILRDKTIKGFISNDYQNLRYNFHSDIYIKLSKTFDIQTGFMGSVSSVSNNLLLNTKLLLKLGKKKTEKHDLIYFGIGYRHSDAVILMSGLRFHGWNVGISYDITVSEANLYNNGRGAMELGISKIFAIPKKPDIIPVLVCPEL